MSKSYKTKKYHCFIEHEFCGYWIYETDSLKKARKKVKCAVRISDVPSGYVRTREGNRVFEYTGLGIHG